MSVAVVVAPRGDTDDAPIARSLASHTRSDSAQSVSSMSVAGGASSLDISEQAMAKAVGVWTRLNWLKGSVIPTLRR